MRFRTVVASLGGACAVLIGLAWPAAAATPRVSTAGDTQLSVTGNRAFSEITGCLSSADTLLAMIVVDESGSLRSTDPSALRVPAITSAVDALEELKANAPGRLNVEVAMSTFARGYDRLVGWGKLRKKHAQRLREKATTELPKRNSGDATDYRQALAGAQRQLDARADEIPDASACKVMLWFTDGALDVDSATAAAADELCRRQGIVDAVRRDHIFVVALALFNARGEVTNAQRDQLRAVAEGAGQAASCGRTPIASDASSGVYLSADDPASLRRLFAGATALISGATTGSTTDCPSADCPKGLFTFDLDPGVGGFRVVADVGADGTPPSLVTPAGKRLRLPVSGGESYPVPGGSLEAFARDGLVTATMLTESLPVRSTHWQVDLGRAPGGVDLYWYWGADLTVDSPELVAGSDAQVQGSITGPDGEPLDPRLYGRLEVKAQVGSETGIANVNSAGAFVADVALPVDSGRSEVTVRVSATARTRGSGVELGPLTLGATAPITLPPAFPSLSPTSLKLPGLEGTGVRTAVIGLTGSKLGATRVCLAGSSMVGPGGGRMDANVRGDDCAELAAGAQSALRIDLEPAAAADGVATGDLTFDVTGANDSGTIEVSVPTEFDLTRPVDESTRWSLVALLVGLALLVPVLLLLLAEWLLGRFSITPTHQTAAVPVRLTKSGPERLTGSGEGPLVSAELTNLSLSRAKRFRRYAVPRTDAVLRVGRRWDILRGSKGVVCVGEGALVASGIAPFSRRAGREAEVGLGYANLWFVVTDAAAVQASETPEATLVALFPTDDALLSERVAEIRRAPWESILAVLIGHAAITSQQPSAHVQDIVRDAQHDTGDHAVPSWMAASGGSDGTGSELPSWLSDADAAPAGPRQTSTRMQRTRRDEETLTSSTPADLPPMDFLN